MRELDLKLLRWMRTHGHSRGLEDAAVPQGATVFSQGDLGPIMVSTRVNLGAPFSTPIAVRSGIAGNFPSISGDKLALYYIAQTTGINGELRKTTRTAVGQPWSAPAAVPLTGVVEIYSSIAGHSG